MSKIVVLGRTGMLGRYVYSYLRNMDENVLGTTRDILDATDEPSNIMQWLNDNCEPGDVIVNCIGIITQKIDIFNDDTSMVITVNSLFPHLIAEYCRPKGIKFIHITTDCVFSGKDGNYSELHGHDSTELYGMSKSLGEPISATVIRTSIIGEETDTNYSLLSWFLSQNKTTHGYTNHFWNGVTCLELAKIIHSMIQRNKFWIGIRHVFSSEQVSKHELLKIMANVYNKNIEIIPKKVYGTCDRTLTTAHREGIIVSKSLSDQITEMKDYSKHLLS